MGGSNRGGYVREGIGRGRSWPWGELPVGGSNRGRIVKDGIVHGGKFPVREAQGGTARG